MPCMHVIFYCCSEPTFRTKLSCPPMCASRRSISELKIWDVALALILGCGEISKKQSTRFYRWCSRNRTRRSCNKRCTKLRRCVETLTSTSIRDTNGDRFVLNTWQPRSASWRALTPCLLLTQGWPRSGRHAISNQRKG